jgi:hypothetical protein
MRFFSTNVPMLVGRQFGDEVVLANYETGLYYSMTDTAAKIWLGLKAGLSAEEVVGAFANCHATDAKIVEASVADFVDRLSAERIIVPAAQAGERQDWHLVETGQFRPPELERYDDLRDLLLLDPVHDVDEAGWPVRTSDAG